MDDCLHCNEMPIDGATLRQALHQKGINLRYLGHLISSISQSDHKEQLRHITVRTISAHRIKKQTNKQKLPTILFW